MMPRDAPLFVHSDMARGMIAAKRAGARIDPRAVQDSLVDFLSGLVEGGKDNLIFPAFNYDYGSNRRFDVDSDPVQVGALPEWLRQNGGLQRSRVPFFSVLSGRDLDLETDGRIDPFGEASAFQWLVDNDATLTLLGAPLHSLTFIHHVEEMSGGPLYRYSKSFPGQITRQGMTAPCDFAMHVRPMGVHLDYDWPRIDAELRAEGLLQRAEATPDLQWLNARALREFWGNRLASDPFHLLDTPSRAHFEKATDGGRIRVKQGEYEDV